MSRGRNTIGLVAPEKIRSGFKNLVEYVSTNVEAAVRPAAQAGAQVLYDAVKLNVSAMRTVTGNLYNSIYQVYSADNSGKGYATYHVSWNHIKAPHGHLLEYGHLERPSKKNPNKQRRHVGARPFIRPAIAKFPEAYAAMETELFRYINEGQRKSR